MYVRSFSLLQMFISTRDKLTNMTKVLIPDSMKNGVYTKVHEIFSCKSSLVAKSEKNPKFIHKIHPRT